MDNETVDKRIVEAVGRGCNLFYMIDARVGAESFRQVDRRLQALRKRGVLIYDRKAGWNIAGEPHAQT